MLQLKVLLVVTDEVHNNTAGLLPDHFPEVRVVWLFHRSHLVQLKRDSQ